MRQGQQVIDSATSYGVGGVGIAVGHLVEVASLAEAIAIILGCIVVAIRLVHDGLKLYRYWRGK